MHIPSNILLLIDGSSFLHRAFNALPRLINSRGEPTGAVLGVANMLRKWMATYPGSAIGVVFDAPGPTFREKLYHAYKAHRPSLPEELRKQIAPLHALVRALGLPLLCESGVEADDVIATLATRAAQQGYFVIIATSDKDLVQLVNESIIVEDSFHNVRLDYDGVITRFGVPPHRIVDYIALTGDESDNIPGVPKVGPKTAAKWLQQYGSLHDLIQHATNLTGKVGESFRSSLSGLALSQDLATLRCDLELTYNPEDLTPRPPDYEALYTCLTQLEFHSWLRTLPRRPRAHPHQYESVLTMEALARWKKQLETAEWIAIDTETTSLDYMYAEIVGISFSVEKGKAAYVPMVHDYPGRPEQLPRDYVLRQLAPLLENPHLPKIGQNLKYDAHVLRHHGINLQGIRHDTMLESYVLNSVATRHDMDSLAAHYLGRTTLRYEEVAGKGNKQIPFEQVHIEAATEYAAEDAEVTLALHEHLWPRIMMEPTLYRVYSTLEMPLIPVLCRLEQAGVLVDVFKLAEHSDALALRLVEMEEEARHVAGRAFNLHSPKQIQEILYHELKLPILKKTPKGQPSTDESVLTELAEHHPLPQLILDYRSIAKLKSTYTDALPQQIHPKTGRVHTSYHQAVTATGRLSSSNPNLQNIPVRTIEGRRIRQAFIARPNHWILAADYSQIELRIMAHLSGDVQLRAAFSQGTDVHRHTAADVFGIHPDHVTDEQRRSAKAINFGLIYGMSAFGLAKQLGVGQSLAQLYLEVYFRRYPGIKAFMEYSRADARKKGYVETLFGRRLYLPDIQSKKAPDRQAAERTAINAPMQGTAADIIKQAMITVDAWIASLPSPKPITMIMQVHDELVFEVVDYFVQEASEKITELMVQSAQMSVPLEVQIGVGAHWDEAH